MANFALSLINPETSKPDITVANDIMTIVDHSNYGESVPEAGHARANFTDFYRLKIDLPTGDSFLYSTLIGDGDELIDPPSDGDPEVAYPYTTGDGQYWITIYTVPTYSAGASYLYTTTPYVYYDGKVWRILQDVSGTTPIEGDYYAEVTDWELLPDKYRLAQRVVVYNQAKRTWARRVYNANAVNERIGDNWEKLLKDPEFIDAMRLDLSIRAIPILMAASQWNKVDSNINSMKQISSKYEV